MAYTTITDPSAYFQTLLYSGNASTNVLTNSANAGNVQPDWLWLKCRNDAVSHNVFDTSRQTSGESTLVIRPNSAGTESNVSGDGMTSIDSNGFTLNGGGSGGGVNESGKTYVAWQWKANGGTTSSNSDGSITSTVQANTTAGFSIVTYTGTGSAATIGHGLGAVPKIIILKERSSNSSWQVYHVGIGATKRLELNLTNAETTTSGTWNDTTPTSSVFSIGTSGGVNENTQTYVAYCFAEKQGYSKFGSYTGNGSADGMFIYTGFKPAWVMIKSTSLTQGWGIWDNKRTPLNLSNKILIASSSTSELTGFGIDILSNGFKLRSTDANSNQSGATYIYMAFAQNPLVATNDVIALAR